MKIFIKNLIRTLKWEYRYACVRSPKKRGLLTFNPEHDSRIIEDLDNRGFQIKHYTIDVDDYRQYIKKAGYDRYDYQDHGKAANFPEKSLEHYLSTQFLDLKNGDVFIDIANDHSPVPEIFSSLFNCIVYRQDIVFPEGISGLMIGGNAATMPVRDGFASKIALHCSFEHFERDDDINFIREVNRVLFSGGKMVVCPLYLSISHIIQTNPWYVTKSETETFDSTALIYCAKNWNNRHGRFYDANALDSRIRSALESLTLTLYVIENAREVDPSCYVKFLALFEKS